MNEYLLTWDGSKGNIISGGWFLSTDEKFLLSFDYGSLYYEPATFVAFYTSENDPSNRMDLTEEQIAEIKDLCDNWWEEQDFLVQAYDKESGLFLGTLYRKLADREGLHFRVNEIPEHPASKWNGTSWERIALAVYENGSTMRYPEGISGDCIWGYTEEEASKLPESPSFRHHFNIVTEQWYDPRTLERARFDALSSTRARFELVRHNSMKDNVYVPSYEAETWTWQVMEAKAWLEDESSATPYIDAFLSARTDTVPSKREFCEDVIRNHNAFLNMVASVNAAQWSFISRIKKATTNEECDVIYNEAVSFCDNTYEEILR